jgi:hypothetical protein
MDVFLAGMAHRRYGMNALLVNARAHDLTSIPHILSTPTVNTTTAHGTSGSDAKVSVVSLDKTKSLAELFSIEPREMYKSKQSRKYKSTKRPSKTEHFVSHGRFKRLFNVTLGQLEAELAISCPCGFNCHLQFSALDAVECRKRNYSKSESGLTGLLSELFWNCGEDKGQIQYSFKGKRICKDRFMILWGVGDFKMRKARKMYSNGTSVSVHGLSGRLRENTKDDWVHDFLMLYFQEECEVISDGKWHLHDTTGVDVILQAVLAEWTDPKIFKGKPANAAPPNIEQVKRIMKKDFPFVQWFRKGEFGQCSICTSLSDRKKKGFLSEDERRDWEFEHQLHAKIHRLCRRNAELRQARIKKSPMLFHGYQFDWTRPFKVLWARRSRDIFRDRHVPRLILGININVHRNIDYLLVHAESIPHGVNHAYRFVFLLPRRFVVWRLGGVGRRTDLLSRHGWRKREHCRSIRWISCLACPDRLVEQDRVLSKHHQTWARWSRPKVPHR